LSAGGNVLPNLNPFEQPWAEADDISLLVETEKELQEAEGFIADGRSFVVRGSRGSGKTAFLRLCEARFSSLFQGNILRVNLCQFDTSFLPSRADASINVLERLIQKAGIRQKRSLFLIDDLLNLNITDIRSFVSSIESKNKSICAISTNSFTPAPDELGEINLDKLFHINNNVFIGDILSRRVEKFAEKHNKSRDEIVRLSNSIKLAAANLSDRASPRQAMLSARQIVETWEREKTQSAENQSEAIILHRIQSYLKNRVDFVGLIAAIAIYMLATSSADKKDDRDQERYETVVKTIERVTVDTPWHAITYRTTTSLNLRDAPNVHGNIGAVLEEGEDLEILGTKGIWMFVRVRRSTIEGWVHGRYVTPVFNPSRHSRLK
jgi:SH3 domain-containing protein